MIIANPMYDVVFKYLMSDSKIAKMLIAAIIGEEIVELDFRQTEHQAEIKSRNLLVYRLDFAAKILQADGSHKLVLIEIQKAKFPSDIMRFRRYLGNQYANGDNVVAEPQSEYNALPIITIYFLGHKLQHTTAPVIKVQREYVNVITGELLIDREEFIESLTHDSFIIQIPYLSEKRRTELEQILSIFDQSKAIENQHFLALREDDYPDKYSEVIRRLLKAAEEQDVRETMTIEDEVLGDLESLERKIQQKEDELERKEDELEQKEDELGQKGEELEQKDKLLVEKIKTIEVKDKSLQEKDKALLNAYKLLVDAGVPSDLAKKQLGL